MAESQDRRGCWRALSLEALGGVGLPPGPFPSQKVGPYSCKHGCARVGPGYLLLALPVSITWSRYLGLSCQHPLTLSGIWTWNLAREYSSHPTL